MGLLDVENVSVRFGGLTALAHVSAGVDDGEVVGVIGPNGAGKTTLFNVGCGFVRPTEGELRWRGKPLRRHRPHQLADLGIARTLQGLGLFPHLTVLDNVLVGADRHSRAWFGSGLLALPRGDRDERQLKARAMAALEQLGAVDASGLLPGQLPYGVQKRVALARALVSDPALLLLEQPKPAARLIAPRTIKLRFKVDVVIIDVLDIEARRRSVLQTGYIQASICPRP